MANESSWLKLFEKYFRNAVDDCGGICRWTKLSVNAHRGTPDVNGYMRYPDSEHGVSFWLEAKRRTWPTIAQAVRLAHCAGIGEQCFLLRLPTKKEAHLYTVRKSARLIMDETEHPYEDIYELIVSGTWEKVAHSFVCNYIEQKCY